MQDDLPATYLDLYRAPTYIYWLKMKAAMTSARLFGYWDYPRARAATNAEEMTFIDEVYWCYKLARPTVRAEKNVSEVLFLLDNSSVKLPLGFKTDTSATLAAAGDLMPADGLESSKDILFENIADELFNVDISFANLEGPVTEKYVEYHPGTNLLNFSIAQFATLAGYRGKYFETLSFCNNHTFDWGIEGVETTQRLFTQYGIIDVGTPRSPEKYGRATILTKKQIKVGFISATFGINGLELPANEGYRIHRAKLCSKHVATDLELFKNQIDDCRKQSCDFIVASIHWGYEFEFFPRRRQIEAAHTLIEEGVDLILGHHPHVIQPVEYYCTKRDPNRIAVIAYSLGGLGWRWYTAPHFALGVILNMKLSKGFINGTTRTYIESIKPMPVFQSISCQADTRLKRIEKLQEHLNGSRSPHPAPYLRQMKEYADLVLGNSII